MWLSGEGLNSPKTISKQFLATIENFQFFYNNQIFIRPRDDIFVDSDHDLHFLPFSTTVIPDIFRLFAEMRARE